jgi:2-phosphosulfolactate phosphatase
MQKDWFGQNGYRVRLEWGRDGAKRAAARGDLLVVVDVLSFSSAVVTACRQGGIVYPCTDQAEAVALAERVGAEAAVHRRDVPDRGRFSLSPPTFLNLEPGAKVALASPNGATCCRYASPVSPLFVGALLNAAAVAAAVRQTLAPTGDGVTVLACGERWQTPSEEGELRFALEDYLGAGAILSGLDLPLSPEAAVCRGAFLQAKSELVTLLRECGSGRELCEKGYPEDVEHAGRWNLYAAVPVLRGERLERWEPKC